MIIIDTFELFVKFALFWGLTGFSLGLLAGILIFYKGSSMHKKINCIHANKNGECTHLKMISRFLFFTWKPVCIEYENTECALKELNEKPER